MFWPRVGAIHAIPTEPTEVPSFSVSYMTPYIKDRETGERLAVPSALRQNRGAVQRATLETGAITLPQQGYDLFAAAGATKLAGDAIDVDFLLTEAVVEVLNGSGAAAEQVTVPLRVRMDAGTSQLSATVSAAHSDGTPVTDTVFLNVERREGLLTGGSVLNAVKSVKIQGFLASDNNNRSTEVGFDIDTRDVNVSTGAPLDAPIPTSFLQDTMALYNVDGSLRVVEIMTDILAQTVDYEADDFLDAAHAENEYDAAQTQFVGEFDVHPSAAYSGSPKDWRTELRTVIDHMATRMKNASNFTGGKFQVLGNPLDTQLIPNVDWTFSGSNEERAGVEVDYSLGSAQGAHRYGITSSSNVEAGALKVVFVPSNPEQMTFKYYPYAFNIDQSGQTRSPNQPNVRAISMNRRHAFHVMTPSVGKITVKNNDGTLPA